MAHRLIFEQFNFKIADSNSESKKLWTFGRIANFRIADWQPYLIYNPPKRQSENNASSNTSQSFFIPNNTSSSPYVSRIPNIENYAPFIGYHIITKINLWYFLISYHMNNINVTKLYFFLHICLLRNPMTLPWRSTWACICWLTPPWLPWTLKPGTFKLSTKKYYYLIFISFRLKN